MGDKTPTEKLLEASGARRNVPGGKPVQDRVAQMELLFKEVMADLQKDRASAKLVQDRGEVMIESLKKYCRETLPRELAGSIDGVAELGVNKALSPLNESLRRAVADVEECRKSLGQISWYWLRDWGLAGIFAGLVGGLLVRLMVGGQTEEAKRYEVWGRRIEQKIERCPAKAREQFYQWAGGRP